MKKALRQRTLRVHFGEPEDFLATSFLHAGPPEEDDEPDEETRARNEVKARLAGALGVDDVSMFKHLLVEIPELVETHLDRPLAHLAAQHGALKILQECVSKPADSINAASSDFEATTPLFWAVKEGHADVTDWLLNNGAFHQPLNVYQDSVVYVAVYYNQTHILDVLKTHRCDCNVPNRSCDLPLMHVIRTGNTAALDCLIEMGVDIYGRTVDRGPHRRDRPALPTHGMEYAIWMIQSGVTAEIISRLIAAGYNVNEPMTLQTQQFKKETHSALEWAVTCYNSEAVKVILPHVTSAERLAAAAKKAVHREKLSILKLLVEAGAEVDIVPAIRKNREHILDYLLTSGVRLRGTHALYRCVHFTTNGTRHAEMLPCYGGRFQRREALVECHTAYRSILQRLLSAGACLDEVYPETGVTALRHGAASGLVCLTLDLLRAGADPSIPDNNGCTALQYTLEDCVNRFVPRPKRQRLTAMAAVLTEFIPYFEREPIAQHLLEEAGESQSGLPEELRALLEANTTAPRPLQHLTRCAILKYLRPHSDRKVPQLCLPPRVTEYLLLADLYDLNAAYAEHLQPQPTDFCYLHRTWLAEHGQNQGGEQCRDVCACDPTALWFTCFNL